MNNVPVRIGRYRVLGELGRGGMSVVYHGLDTRLERHVAIKVLHSHLAADQSSRERFLQEAKAVARLHHPHIIEIHDFSESAEGPSYLVCEYVDGRTLRKFMEDTGIFFAEVAAVLMLPVCRAVAHAHSLGVIHRDLKPENIMVTEGGQIKLMDFGIAKILDQSKQMTLTGSLVGSPAHMSPEQLEGRNVDFRSDVFSLGTIMYWLATGKLPFEGRTPHQVIKNIVEGRYPDPLQVNPTVGEGLARIIRRALSTDPGQRQQSSDELVEQLQRYCGESGLDDTDAWLVALLKDPAESFDRLKRDVLENLRSKGQRLYDERNYARALQVFDRVLALDPEDRHVLELVSGMQRRRKIKRLAARGLGIAGLAIVAVLGWLIWPKGSTFEKPEESAGFPATPSEEENNTAVVDAGIATQEAASGREEQRASVLDGGAAEKGRGLASVSHPDGGIGRGDSGPGNTARRVRESNRRRVASSRQESFPVEIVAEPFFESIFIDGRKVATSSDRKTMFGHVWRGKLPAGRHRVVLRHPACAEDSFDLILPGKGQVRRKLHFLPALLEIDSHDPRAEIYVDGNYRGTAVESMSNPIVITMETSPTSVVELKVVDSQGRKVARRVKVRAGRTTRLELGREEFRGGSGG